MQIKKSSFPLLGLCFFIGHIPKILSNTPDKHRPDRDIERDNGPKRLTT